MRSDKSDMSDHLPPASPGIGLPLSAAVIQHRCAELAGEQDARAITAKLREVAAALKMTAMALDPPPAVQHTDRPAPPAAPGRPRRNSPPSPKPSAPRCATTPWRARPSRCCRTANSPRCKSPAPRAFTEALFTLLTDTLDRYAAVTPDVENRQLRDPPPRRRAGTPPYLRYETLRENTERQAKE